MNSYPPSHFKRIRFTKKKLRFDDFYQKGYFTVDMLKAPLGTKCFVQGYYTPSQKDMIFFLIASPGSFRFLHGKKSQKNLQELADSDWSGNS